MVPVSSSRIESKHAAFVSLLQSSDTVNSPPSESNISGRPFSEWSLSGPFNQSGLLARAEGLMPRSRQYVAGSLSWDSGSTVADDVMQLCIVTCHLTCLISLASLVHILSSLHHLIFSLLVSFIKNMIEAYCFTSLASDHLYTSTIMTHIIMQK